MVELKDAPASTSKGLRIGPRVTWRYACPAALGLVVALSYICHDVVAAARSVSTGHSETGRCTADCEPSFVRIADNPLEARVKLSRTGLLARHAGPLPLDLNKPASSGESLSWCWLIIWRDMFGCGRLLDRLFAPRRAVPLIYNSGIPGSVMNTIAEFFTSSAFGFLLKLLSATLKESAMLNELPTCDFSQPYRSLLRSLRSMPNQCGRSSRWDR